MHPALVFIQENQQGFLLLAVLDKWFLELLLFLWHCHCRLLSAYLGLSPEVLVLSTA